jgi:hypothetical protein
LVRLHRVIVGSPADSAMNISYVGHEKRSVAHLGANVSNTGVASSTQSAVPGHSRFR